MQPQTNDASKPPIPNPDSPREAGSPVIPSSDPPVVTTPITIRAIVVGLLLGVFTAGVGIINNFKLGMSPLNVGHLPVVLVGIIIVAMMTLNPLLGLLERAFNRTVRLRFVAAEWAVILAISCVAVPVMQQVGETLPGLGNMPKVYSTNAGWKAEKLLVDEQDNLTYLEPGVVFNDGRYSKKEDSDRVSAFLNGPPPGVKPDAAYMSQAWAVWRPVMMTWGPVLIFFFVGLMALTLVVHRQWAVREHIRFPIADFISTIVHGRSQNTIESAVATGQSRSLFQMPAFWIFFGAIFGLHLLNGLGTMYWPNLPRIPNAIAMYPQIAQKFPEIGMGGLGWKAYQGLLFPSIIAFSFFLSREVSLGVGLAPLLHEIYFAIMITVFAINPTEPSDVCWGKGFFNMGALLAIFLSILWLGRSYYFPLVAQALGAPGRGGRRLEGVWAMRVFLLGMALTIGFLWLRVGVEWPFAVMFIVILVIVQVVVARISAETGLFVYGLSFFANEVVIAVFGFEAVGPRLAMLSAMFMIILITSWSNQPLIPIAINSMEVCRRQKLNVGRVGVLAGIMVVLAFGVATYVMMNESYKNPAGVEGFKNQSTGNAQWPFLMGATAVSKAKDSGSLDNVVNKTTWERLSKAKPIRGLGPWFAVGFGLTVLLTFLRLRFTWWPIHPVVMAVWGVWAMAAVGFSFLVGWALRSALSALFGEAMVEKAKPAMIGVIAGELVAAVFWFSVGWADSFSEVRSLTPYQVFQF